VRSGTQTQPAIGGPGRLVSSIALVAPKGSFIRVADTENPWPLREFVVYDDSFLHYFSNQHELNQSLLVLSFFTWHPDILTRNGGKLNGETVLS
jgi:hypothetical protein